MSDAPTPSLPRELQVEVTGACNLRCRMCLVRYRPPLGRRDGSLDFDVFRRLVDDLPDLERLTLQGLGEPLLAPDLTRMIAHATARGVRVGFNTNATLLTRARARELIASGLDWLHVSLDGATAATYEAIRDGASFARVCENVAGLMEERTASGCQRPDVWLVFVAMRRNVAELAELVRLAHRLGVHRVRVQNLAHSFSDTAPESGYAEIREFSVNEALWQDGRRLAHTPFAAAAAEAARLGVELRLPEVEERPPRAGAPGCGWPWNGAYVRHDGAVQPCCMLMGGDRAIQGRIDEQGFAAVWAGESYARFRSALVEGPAPDVCQGCSMYRGVF